MEHNGWQRRVMAAGVDLRLARVEFDDATCWLAAAANASSPEPLAAEVWVFDASLCQVLLVCHPWRGWVPPGGKVEPGETPREAARRELLEETGLDVQLLAHPAAGTVRSYHPDWPVTLGLSYVAIADSASPLMPEHGQPAAWTSLADPWESCFPEDPARIRQHARWLAAGELDVEAQ